MSFVRCFSSEPREMCGLTVSSVLDHVSNCVAWEFDNVSVRPGAVSRDSVTQIADNRVAPAFLTRHARGNPQCRGRLFPYAQSSRSFAALLGLHAHAHLSVCCFSPHLASHNKPCCFLGNFGARPALHRCRRATTSTKGKDSWVRAKGVLLDSPV